MDIWDADDETHSCVMILWGEPEFMVEKYYDSTGYFFPVGIYKPTLDCIDSNTNATDRCMYDPEVYTGPKEGSCGQEMAPLKIDISSKPHIVQLKIPESVLS